jgi:hypothetical protein
LTEVGAAFGWKTVSWPRLAQLSVKKTVFDGGWPGFRPKSGFLTKSGAASA